MANRSIDVNTLNAAMAGSEMTETTITKEEIEQEPRVVVRSKPRRVSRTMSISLSLEDYNKFQQYLIDNEIFSGSAFIRDLLKKEGIL
ncbi:hypothetical protein CFT12S00416_08925 [Campylobacter fetus subsp. testudinum]|uniref:hypothetical protein n=1 Tax=Campylobacter fetus TaxID=196 RepID=UPI0008189B44|nr:hypothetical protein [Campylobacter fetus]OCR86948.1 hypothetical protein CFT12S00416_08925 [Campylobacter fetus subsp. testudinum]OCR98939.1 hypothetical protein A9K75_09200 [Campylobacter fetus subsp. testudinum]